MRDRVILVASRILELPADAIVDDSSPENVKSWDSLKHMNLVLALEEEFDIHFSDETIVSMLNIRTIVAAVAQLVPQAASDTGR